MVFQLQAIHFNDLSNSQRAELKANGCKYIRRLNLWLFEGDWELCFEDLNGITEVGSVVLENLGNYSEKQLLAEVSKQLKLDPMQTYTLKGE